MFKINNKWSELKKKHFLFSHKISVLNPPLGNSTNHCDYS